MRRAPVVVSALLAVLAAAAAPPAAAQETVEPARPPLRATLAACATGPTEAERFAVFTGSMPAMRGTQRMAMRFDLQVRPAGGDASDWELVRSKGFGRWERSDAGKSGFVYTKRVERLRQDAEYRAIVRFRWYGAEGIQRTTVRRTPVCVQPDQRPNLRLAAFDVRPGPDEASTRYVLVVENVGRTAAGPFDVGVAGIDGPVAPVAGLPAGERTTVEVVGPRCTADRPALVLVDTEGAVDESNERDNRSRWACGGR